MLTSLFNRLFLEYPCWETEWQGISLVDVARKKGVPLHNVAARDMYAAFYSKLESNGFKFDPDWVKTKKESSKKMRGYINERLHTQSDARCLSIGAGTGVVEEDILNDGIAIDLQECQSSSLNYLRSKNIAFKSYIGTDLSVITDAQYDLIFVFTISYCLSYSEYQSFFHQIHRMLKTGGRCILFDCNVIHGRGCMASHLLCHPFRFTRFNKNEVFWGWFRHPTLHQALAEDAELTQIDHFIEDKQTWHVFEKQEMDKWSTLNSSGAEALHGHYP